MRLFERRRLSKRSRPGSVLWTTWSSDYFSSERRPESLNCRFSPLRALNRLRSIRGDGRACGCWRRVGHVLFFGFRHIVRGESSSPAKHGDITGLVQAQSWTAVHILISLANQDVALEIANRVAVPMRPLLIEQMQITQFVH